PVKADDFQLVFEDISVLNPRALKPAFVQDFIKRTSETPQYIVAENLKNVMNNQGKMLPFSHCFVLLSTEKETKRRRGLAFFELEDGNLLPIGAWPAEFAGEIQGNPDLLITYIVDIIEKSDTFEDARILIPISKDAESATPKEILWSVLFEGEQPGPEDDWVHEFVDSKQDIAASVQINVEFFRDLLTTCKSSTHYQIMRQIKQIKSNLNEVVPIESSFIISAQRKEDGLQVDLLLNQTDQGIETIGIWPLQAADFFRKNQDLLKTFIVQIIKCPELFERVNIFISVELEQEIIKEPLWVPKYAAEHADIKNGIQFLNTPEVIQSISLLNTFFQRLESLTKEQSHYKLSPEILEFNLDTGQTIAREKGAFVLAIDKGKNQHGILFKKDARNQDCIQGLWPQEFLIQALVNDKVLFDFVDAVITTPKEFKEVKVLLPK
ncbi:MAG: hypothetical protein LUQ65_04300, partial [Candidatus Helarchaeota archaeon]|nr:hypothetical protein [Candidatus Helarchaeota archaeon]